LVLCFPVTVKLKLGIGGRPLSIAQLDVQLNIKEWGIWNPSPFGTGSAGLVIGNTEPLPRTAQT
jgi:hypothetical protein